MGLGKVSLEVGENPDMQVSEIVRIIWTHNSLLTALSARNVYYN